MFRPFQTLSCRHLVPSLQRCRGAANSMPLADLTVGCPSVGAVVTDFNKHFFDTTFHSQLDTNSSVEAVTSAALIAARALHDLASGTGVTKELKASTLYVVAHCTDCVVITCLCCTVVCLMMAQWQSGTAAGSVLV